jgi:hypothetical protein
MKGSIIIIGIIAAAVAVGAVVAFTSTQPEKEEVESNFPIRVDFARVIPYENSTSYPNITRGFVMNIRLLYGEDGPPRPFYLLLAKQGESWDQVTDPEQWVKQKNHGFEVLSSSKEFDMFTEYYPFDSAQLPAEMRLWCGVCEEKWSKPEIVWQGVDERIAKIRGFLVTEGTEKYTGAFALGNSQIDSLPAKGMVGVRITDGIGVSLYEKQFEVQPQDFKVDDSPIRLLRVPMGGRAYCLFEIPTSEIKFSPTGQKEGVAFMNFMLEDGRILSANAPVKIPPLGS